MSLLEKLFGHEKAQREAAKEQKRLKKIFKRRERTRRGFRTKGGKPTGVSMPRKRSLR